LKSLSGPGHVISVPAIDGIVVKSVAGYCTEVTYD